MKVYYTCQLQWSKHIERFFSPLMLSRLLPICTGSTIKASGCSFSLSVNASFVCKILNCKCWLLYPSVKITISIRQRKARSTRFALTLGKSQGTVCFYSGLSKRKQSGSKKGREAGFIWFCESIPKEMALLGLRRAARAESDRERMEKNRMSGCSRRLRSRYGG